MTPNTLPSHWQIKKLGEVFLIERGGSPRPIEDFITNDKNGINWIKIGDTKNSIKYITHTKEKIKPEGAKKSRYVEEGDFLLSNSMSFGKPFIMKTNGCIHDGWLVIRKNENINTDYLYHILNSNSLYTQFTNLAKGSTVKNLNIEAVKEAVITFPPLPEQEAIVAKIESLFAELEAGKSALLAAREQIKLYRQSLLKAAFEGKLTESNHKSLEIGHLPEGWKWVKLGEVCLEKEGLRRGPFGSAIKKDFFVPKGYKVYEQSNAIYSDAKRGNYYINQEKYDELKAFNLLPRDIIVSCSGTMGKIYQIPSDAEPGVINQALLRIRLNESIKDKFFIQFFKSEIFQRNILIQSQGTAMLNLIGIKDLREIAIPLPPLSTQEKIVVILEEKLGECDALDATIEKSLTDAELLRQSILKEAFEGRLVKMDV